METKVYVGTYAKYNNGSMAGEWLTLSNYVDAEDFLIACQELHQDEHDPEFMFQDIDGEHFGMITESSIDDNLWELINTLDDNEAEIYAAYRKNFDGDWNECQDAYSGKYDSDEDFAEDMAEQCGMIQDKISWPYTCIDWEWAARELMYDYIEENGHYFRNS
jgi:antirestriction protein